LFSEDVYEFRLRPDREEIYMVKNVQGVGAVVNLPFNLTGSR